MVSFPQLQSWIRAGDTGRVGAALLALDEPSRRALAGDVKALRTRAPWETAARQEDALRVAGAACLPRAADVVAFLRSDRFWHVPADRNVDVLVSVLRAPGRPSIAAIARAMADRLRPAQVDVQWPVIARLLTEAELPPPATEAVVRGWMRRAGEGKYRTDLADLLRADPLMPSMLPHVFAIPLLGQELDEEWTKALATLAGQGVIDRGELLDGCVLRLHGGDRPGALRRVVVLHRLLDPEPAEFAQRRAEYTGMLASPDSTVAGLALRGLRGADDAGLLDTGTVVEAAFTVLPRAEKKLVRAQLDWLEAALARKPDPVLFEALLSGLTNPAVDLAERALRLAARHLGSFGPDGRARSATAAADLQGDLRRQAITLFGLDPATSGASEPGSTTGAATAAGVPGAAGAGAAGVAGAGVAGIAIRIGVAGAGVAGVAGTAWVAGPTPTCQPSVPARTGGSRAAVAVPAWPEPIASVPELVAEIKHLLYEPDHRRMETALDGLARFAADDRPALAVALRPIIPSWSSPLNNLLRAVADREFRAWVPYQWDHENAAPFWMLPERMVELTRQMCTTPPPALLATPATVDGHVDPARVLRLLSEHADPGPFDLAQAMLRLPREIDPAIRTAAGSLTSPAGRIFARVLAAGGIPDPEVVSLTSPHTVLADQRTVAFAAIETELTVPPHLLDMPVDGAARRAGLWRSEDLLESFPLILPSHREIAAAHIQPFLIEKSHSRGGSARATVLPTLAACDGPFGTAMALCLAYGMVSVTAAGRRAAADAFLDLAGRDLMDGSLVGAELRALHDAGALVGKRLADSLTQILAGGAAAEVWATVRPLLPALLSASKPPPGTPDLLAVASAAASGARVTDHLPELEPLTARPARSRLATEAARLSRTLAADQVPS